MFKLILGFLFAIVGCESAKILAIWPSPSISHQVVFRPVMLELVNRGHEVTVITTDPLYPKGDGPKNLIEIDVHDVSYAHWNKFITQNGNVKDPITFYRLMHDALLEIVEVQLKSDEVKKLLAENKKFDLLFIESVMRPAHIYAHIYKAPVITFSSGSGVFGAFEAAGVASHPLIYPNVFQRRIFNLTMWEKVNELYVYYSLLGYYTQHVHKENERLKLIFGPDVPDLNELRANIDMMFLNVHAVWDLNRPAPPNVVYLGGLHQKPPRELQADIKSYLDSSKNGVIYISFGTNVKPSMLPADKLKILTDVFSQLPYDVLWKWDKDELPGRSKNIRISKWLPQSDLLRHPKVKLFITQGGLQSTDEAITAGVPLIGIPMFADQWYNVEQYVKFNIGKKIIIDTMTEAQLRDSIDTIIDDKSYHDSVVRLRNVIEDQPQTPLERAVWWTEYVLRHGGAHLRAPEVHVKWTEYYEIEIVLLLLSSLAVLLSVIILSIRYIVSKITHTGKVKTN